MPRFVILRHETPPGYERPAHFDLMLEWGDRLRTWAIGAIPRRGESIAAEELAPHRRAYLDYEGEVSAGRGRVSRIAAGEYELVEAMSNLLRVELSGQELRGALRLARLTAESALWTVTFDLAPDEMPDQ